MASKIEDKDLGLADFILRNLDLILLDWDAYARSIWPGPIPDPVVVRDDGEKMMLSLVEDMRLPQSSNEQNEKSKGNRDMGSGNPLGATASSLHAQHRMASGFDILMMISEYRALRANVLRLWQLRLHICDLARLEEVTRFNECIDQLLANSSRYFSERLEQSRKTFLGILGHDLRNPLHAVSMLSDILCRNRNLDPDSAELADRIGSSVKAMGALIKDLLDFTGGQMSVGMAVNLEAMDLGLLCLEVVNELRAVNPSRDFKVQLDDELLGSWDRARLRQLISNLLGNAVQHGSATDPITLTASAVGDKIRISVHNFGKPIPCEDFGLIFEPMARTYAPESARPAGSIGLGLYIAREVVIAHDGTIEVSSSEKEGTSFSALIPSEPRK